MDEFLLTMVKISSCYLIALQRSDFLKKEAYFGGNINFYTDIC